jgi:hypothetical protein
MRLSIPVTVSREEIRNWDSDRSSRFRAGKRDGDEINCLFLSEKYRPTATFFNLSGVCE